MRARFALVVISTVSLLSADVSLAELAQTIVSQDSPGYGGYEQLPPGISRCQQWFDSGRQRTTAVYVVQENPFSRYFLPWVYWGPSALERQPICYLEPGAKIAGALSECRRSKHPDIYGMLMCKMRIGVKDVPRPLLIRGISACHRLGNA